MCLDEFLFIIATSLQVAGGILLIIKYWKKSVKKQLDEADSNRDHVEGEILYIGQSIPPRKEISKEVWLSRMSFVYIVAGYLIGIFGNVGKNRWIDLGIVILFSIILCLISKGIANNKSKR